MKLKSPRQIKRLRESGRMVAEVYEMLRELVVPGITTGEIDRLCEEFILRNRAVPIYKGKKRPGIPPFPASICVAVEDVICHGIPSTKQELVEGQIVGIDIGLSYKGWIADSCITFAVGTVDAESQRLIDVTHRCLELGIEQAQPGNRLGDIGSAIQTFAEAQGFSVVRDLVGHGVGHSLHEGPQVKHHGLPGTGLELQAGMVFTIEPMINAGLPDIVVLQDGWTVCTADGSRSAQFEHTIAITSNGPQVLTAAA